MVVMNEVRCEVELKENLLSKAVFLFRGWGTYKDHGKPGHYRSQDT